jgi:L-ascorbate metabolism protein UlaG (beta-lactamase superfamily)
VTVVTDPHPEEFGYTRPRIRADIVTVSHAHEGHSSIKGFRGSPRVLHSPGEYEIGGVFVTAVPTFHDAAEGQERGQNIAFLFDFDGLTVCHLGDLGHMPDQSQIEQFGQVNVLLIPVGGGSTISASGAAEVVSTIEPNIVIPMHYATEASLRPLGSLSPFLRAMGLGDIAPQEGLQVKKSTFSDEATDVVPLLVKG